MKQSYINLRLTKCDILYRMWLYVRISDTMKLRQMKKNVWKLKKQKAISISV